MGKTETIQCQNTMSDGRISYQCVRDSSGADRLCNVCRAAKARGEKRAKENADREERVWAAQHARDNTRAAVLRAAVIWRRHEGGTAADDLEDAVDAYEKLELRRRQARRNRLGKKG